MTMTRDRLPAFMVIGAVKAATTWLAHQLRSHPMLWLPDAEPHFFSTDYHRGLAWYRSLFAEAPRDRIVGEKSADYLAHPDAAERIARTLPDTRLIVQLRDPVERAYSEYCMLFRRGEIDDDVQRHLDPRANEGSRLLEGGRYSTHLARLFGHVAIESVKIILHDDVRRDPAAIITEICDHIGVPAHIAPDAIADRKNDSGSALLPLALRRMLRPARPLLDPLRAVPLLASARAKIARPVRYPPLGDGARARLRDYYRHDIALLGAMIGRDLDCWEREDSVAA